MLLQVRGGHRVQGTCDLDVMVGVDLGFDPRGHVEGLGGRRQHRGTLGALEHLARDLARRACTRVPATSLHQQAAHRRQSASVSHDSPANQPPRTCCTCRSTRALSRGRATRAGSTKMPRAWTYSPKTSLSRGQVGSAPTIIVVGLSGTSVLGIAPKKRQAASSPSMMAAVVCEKVGHTNMYRLNDKVTISTQSRRGRSESGSCTRPISAKSICASWPAGGSSSSTVALRFPQLADSKASQRGVGHLDAIAREQGVHARQAQALVEPLSDALAVAGQRRARLAGRRRRSRLHVLRDLVHDGRRSAPSSSRCPGSRPPPHSGAPSCGRRASRARST